MEWLAKISNLLDKNIVENLVFLGLENAGKTSIINYIITGFMTQTIPTSGVSIEVIKLPHIELKLYDIGGQKVFRDYMWSNVIFPDMSLVFVIDANDKSKLYESKLVFWEILNKYVPIKPILILLNKQDLDNTVKKIEVHDLFELERISDLKIGLFETSVSKGIGISDAIQWFFENLTENILDVQLSIINIKIYRFDGKLVYEKKLKKEIPDLREKINFSVTLIEFVKERTGKFEDDKFKIIIGKNSKTILFKSTNRNLIVCMTINSSDSESIAYELFQILRDNIPIKWTDKDIKYFVDKFIKNYNQKQFINRFNRNI
ncbi:MAG: hypothetical protein EAX96_15140 [Candidatus Lokiarchaeota archaeon]|nr:hypothetical protein [Candidatus Lokiarchaeota archaeon]